LQEVLSDTDIMKIALAEAEAAAARGEVPVGAVVFDPGTGDVIARDGNRAIESRDPTAHAEILVIREACRLVDNYRLVNLEMFVTLEPCAMCAAAISFARLGRLVFGAMDDKGGAVVSGPRFYAQATCHHRPDVAGSVLAADSAALLRRFFAARR